MKIIQRLKNLWKLSEWQPSNKQIEELHESGRKFAPLTQSPKQMATIIKRKMSDEEFVDELLKE